MWVISLDEGGRFEKAELKSAASQCMMVGGTVYQCRNKDLAAHETARLIRYFRRVCAEQGCNYPQDLHPDHEGGYANAKNVQKVKNALLSSLGDFMQGKGAWADDPPMGTYGLYAIVGDKKGLAGVTQNAKSNLVNDGIASNRYEHMAYRAIQNLLFYNVRCTEHEVRLDLATRCYRALDEKESSDAADGGAEMRRIGLYNATNANSYRAMLLESIMDSSKTDMRFDVNVESIRYDLNHEHQAFLYMADTICTLYQETVRTAANSGDALRYLIAACGRLVKPENLYFWAYHEVDVTYRKAFKAYERHDDFLTLQMISQIRRSGNSYAAAYDDMWLKRIEQLLIENHQPSVIAAQQLNRYLNHPGYVLHTASAIFDTLKQQAQHLPRIEQNARLFCELSRAEMTIRNHYGDYAGSEAAYQNAIDMAQYLPVEDYLDLRNMLTVSMLDAGKTGDALNMATSTLQYAQMLTDIKSEIYQDAKDNHLLLGRTMSQLGQCYAFNGQYTQAIEYFEKAIEAFSDNRVEAEKTRSYLLHALIEARDAAGYAAMAEQYFGVHDIKQQLTAITQLNDISAKFALYVYIKALYFLYINQLDKAFVDQIIREVTVFFQRANDGHPWEMILKYCALIYMKVNKSKGNNTTDTLIKAAEEAVKMSQNGILPTIVAEAKVQYSAAKAQENDVFAHTKLTYMYR